MPVRHVSTQTTRLTQPAPRLRDARSGAGCRVIPGVRRRHMPERPLARPFPRLSAGVAPLVDRRIARRPAGSPCCQRPIVAKATVKRMNADSLLKSADVSTTLVRARQPATVRPPASRGVLGTRTVTGLMRCDTLGMTLSIWPVRFVGIGTRSRPEASPGLTSSQLGLIRPGRRSRGASRTAAP